MVDYKHFDLYKGETVDKQITISFDGGTITNSDLHQEQFELTESLCSENQLVFGSCEASEVKFRISNVFQPLKDKWLTITETLNGNESDPFQFGRYRVYSDKPTADRSYRDVVAYDVMFDIINTDVASWYNGLTFPMSLKAFRDSFFEFFGIEQENVSLVNDSMNIDRTIEPTVLSGKDVIQSICEINGCFGNIGRDGKFQYVHLEDSAQGLYPSNDLYPAENLYPIQSASTTIEKSLYISCEYEDFVSQFITKLQIREKEGDIGGIAGSGDNSYIIEDNFLVYGKSTDELNSIAENVLGIIGKASYRPFKAEVVGNPCFEIGDAIRLFTKYEVVETYILNRTLSGIQCLRDDFSADGEEYFTEKVNDIQTQITQLKGKSNTLERTVEETKSTIADVEQGLQTQITQNAESITQEVSKTYTTKTETGEVKQELSSQIEQTAESIRTEVADETKQLSSQIEQTQSYIVLGVNSQGKMVLVELSADRNTGTAFSVNADNIDLSAEDVISLMAGGNLDLSGKNITISSEKFNVVDGKMSCSEANVTGRVNATTLNVVEKITIFAGTTFNKDCKDAMWVEWGNGENGDDELLIHSNISRLMKNIRAQDIYATHLSSSGDGYVEGDMSIVGTLVVDSTLFFSGHTIETLNSNSMTFRTQYGTLMFIRTNGVDYLRPTSNNASVSALGSSSYKWEDIYVASGGIHDSDKNLKHDINTISEKYEKLFTSLKPCTYIFNGKTRTHMGFISQDVEESLKDVGLTDTEFAGFCKDKKTVETIDENGNVNIEYVYDENGEHEYKYSLRYSEFIALNTHMIQKQQKIIEIQQSEIDELKKSVSFLMQEIERLGGNNG